MAESLPDWAPASVDLTKPSAARMYDYYLGGAHNFEVDRDVARKALELVPNGAQLMLENRAFLHRSVRYLISQGIHQFIDLGSGIPTRGNVHETVDKAMAGTRAQGTGTAEGLVPDGGGRVLYVDHDPVAVGHSELILGEAQPNVRVLLADLRRPQDILNSAQRRAVIDLSRPVGILMVAVLHFVAEADQPAALIGEFRDAVPPGSYLVISHGTAENQPQQAAELAKLYESSPDRPTYRSRSRVRELFDGWELVDPGVVWLQDWHPDWPDDGYLDRSGAAWAAAVGRKPAPPT